MLRSIKRSWPQLCQRPLLRPRISISFTPSLRQYYPEKGVFQQQPPTNPNSSQAPYTPRPVGYPEHGVFSQEQLPGYPSQTGAHTPREPGYPTRYPNYPAPYPPQPPPPSPGQGWRFIPRWTTVFSAVLFTGIGFYFTQAALDFPTPLVPSSDEDREELAYLIEDLDDLLLVKQLRDSWRIVNGVRKPMFQEWTAYENFKDPGLRAAHLSTGPLAGSAGIAAQRIFWDEQEGIMFCFVCFGVATTGWPTMVHGGALATVIDEACSRFAMRKTEERGCMTANLQLKYMAPVQPGQWFVFFGGLDAGHVSTDRKKYINGVLACCSPVAPSLEGHNLNDLHVHVEAKGLFVVPKSHSDFDTIPDNF